MSPRVTGLSAESSTRILARVTTPPDPRDLVDRPIPDLALAASSGQRFRFRDRVGSGPLVLFFYLVDGTPT